MEKKTVMVVDDDDLVRNLLTEVLREDGHNVIEANSGDAAWALIDKGARPDITITDLDMPGSLDGFALIKKLRQKEDAEHSAHIPVIMQSGRSSTDLPGGKILSRREFIKTLPGVNKFLAKPFSFNILSAMVNESLNPAQRRR